jgi:hypothetical protein
VISDEEIFYEIYLNGDRKLAILPMSEKTRWEIMGDNWRQFRRGYWQTERAALEFLNCHYKPEYIDPEYLTPYNREFLLPNKNEWYPQYKCDFGINTGGYGV